MEACFVNLVEPGDKVIVCRNGVFGGRMLENVERCGGVPVVLDETWGEPIDPTSSKPCSRSTRTRKSSPLSMPKPRPARSPMHRRCDVARRHGALTIVDCVTSLGGTPVRVDAWQADAVYRAARSAFPAPRGYRR